MVFLGAIGNAEIDPKILGEFGDIDILFGNLSSFSGEFTYQ